MYHYLCLAHVFRVFSGYVKDVDEKPDATNWGKKMTFGNVMAEFSNGGGLWLVTSGGFSLPLSVVSQYRHYVINYMLQCHKLLAGKGTMEILILSESHVYVRR